jgi:hypothetical protein
MEQQQQQEKIYVLTVSYIVRAAADMSEEQVLDESVRRGYLQSLSHPHTLTAVIETDLNT